VGFTTADVTVAIKEAGAVYSLENWLLSAAMSSMFQQ